MSVEITLNLSEPLIQRAKQFGSATNRDVEAILIDSLEMMWPTLSGLPDFGYPPVKDLSDEEVLTLADTKMDKAQNERLGWLQSKGKEEGLTREEQYELLTLLQILQLGQLRKSEALAEAVKRGLREPIAG